ncbi:hypothetical protein DUNSADRAFT_11033 [Dunaliella salina]|uniref:Sec20 C-terminal domain-containing protein n=1 Tax=Dunaliella salina TaxID=3046 RepID=A0ABQ7GE91_DUNSA|nr:hypothetical protein DUNSADRAFT_11033 [Dunaliella salina]|eukprot:KAF5832921.1 hypothetical protein DUNSADRAFT_11033 [Dunaliella salina]
MQQLGAEEHQLHAASLQVQGSVKSLLANVAQSPEALDRQLQRCMAQLRANIRDLELLAEEQDTDEQACAVEQLLRQHKVEYESLRASITAAKLAAKQAAEMAFAQQRKELLSGAALPMLQRSMGSEAQAADGAQAITESLRRSRMALAQQLDQTAGNLEVTESGTARLSTTKEELSGQEGMFKESRQSLKELRKQSSGDRWLLWAGLSLFLLVAAYIAYKRAPAAAKLPIDAVLGVTWRLLRAAAGVLAFVGQTLVGLVLRGGAALIFAVRNARSSSSSSSSSNTVLHAPGKPLHLQPPAPGPHPQAPLPPPGAPHWEAALNEAHETDGLGIAPETVSEEEESGVDGVKRQETEEVLHDGTTDKSKGEDRMAAKGRDKDEEADEGVEVGADGMGSRSSSFESEGVLDMWEGLPLPAFQDVSEGFGFVGAEGDEGAEGAALVGDEQESMEVQHAQEWDKASGGDGVSAEREGVMREELDREAGAEGEVQKSKVMGGEPGVEKVSREAEQEEESSGAAQAEDGRIGGGRAGKRKSEDEGENSPADGKESVVGVMQGNAAADEEREEKPLGVVRDEGAAGGKNASVGRTASVPQSPEKQRGVITGGGVQGGTEVRQQASRAGADKAAVHEEEAAESGEERVAQEAKQGVRLKVGEAATDASTRTAVGDEAVGAVDEGQKEEPADDELGARTRAKVAKVGQEACDAKGGVKDEHRECAWGADFAGSQGKEEDEEEEALAAQQTGSNQGVESGEKAGTASTEGEHGMDGTAPTEGEHGMEEVTSEEEAEAGKGDKEFLDGRGNAASRSATQDRSASGAAELKEEMEREIPGGDAPGEELDQTLGQQSNTHESSLEPEAEQQGGALGAELDGAEEAAAAEAAAPGVEDAAGRGGEAPAFGRMEMEEGKRRKEGVEGEKQDEQEEDKQEEEEQVQEQEEEEEKEDEKQEEMEGEEKEKQVEEEIEGEKEEEVKEDEQEEQEQKQEEKQVEEELKGEKEDKQEEEEEEEVKEEEQEEQEGKQEEEEVEEEEEEEEKQKDEGEVSGPKEGGQETDEQDEEDAEPALREEGEAHGVPAAENVAGPRDDAYDQQEEQQEQPQQVTAQQAAASMQSRQQHHQEASIPAFPGSRTSKKWPDEHEQEAAMKHAHVTDSAAITEGRASTSSQDNHQRQQQQQQQGLEGVEVLEHKGHQEGAEGLEQESDQEGAEGTEQEGGLKGAEGMEQGGGLEGAEGMEQEGDLEVAEGMEQEGDLEEAEGNEQEGDLKGNEHGGQGLLDRKRQQQQQQQQVEQGNGHEGEPRENKLEDEEGGKEEEEPESEAAEGGKGHEYAVVEDCSTEQGIGRTDLRKQREGSDALDWGKSGMGRKHEGGLESGQGAGIAEEKEDASGKFSQKGDTQSGGTEPMGRQERAKDGKEGEGRAGGTPGRRIKGLGVREKRDVPWATSGERRYSNNTILGGLEGLGFSKQRGGGGKENGG